MSFMKHILQCNQFNRVIFHMRNGKKLSTFSKLLFAPKIRLHAVLQNIHYLLERKLGVKVLRRTG